MKRLSILAVTILTLLALAGVGWATDYYVDADDGLDSNTGLVGHPVKTTSGLDTRWNPAAGDNAYFKKGCTAVYTGYLYENFPGTEANPITISTYGEGAKPVLTRYAPTAKASWTDLGDGRYKITGAGPAPLVVYENLQGIAKGSSTSITAGQWYYDTGPNEVYYRPTDDTWDTESVTIDYGGKIIYVNGGDTSYLTIDGLEVHTPYLFYSANLGVDHLTIQNCDLKDCWGSSAIYINFADALGKNVTYVRILDNTFEYCSNNIYFIAQTCATYYFKDCTISGNTMTNTGITRIGSYKMPSNDCDGISLQNVKDTKVHGNTITGGCFRYAAIHFWYNYGHNVKLDGNEVYKNFIRDVDGIGIMTQNGSSPGHPPSIDIYDNIVSNWGLDSTEGGAGITANVGIYCCSPQDSTDKSRVNNNTLRTGAVGIKLLTSADYWLVKNNIISGATTYFIENTVAIAHNEFAYNDYYNAASGDVFYHGGGAVNWSEWVAAATETGSKTTNPAFLNAGGSYALSTDFIPQTVLAGANLSAYFTTDYAGATRILWQMGAYNWVYGAPGGGLTPGLGLGGGNVPPWMRR